jgi:Holliday junction resolvase RusA-like endonuclease
MSPLCERCTQPYDPPLNRPTWPKCLTCTLTPNSASSRRYGAAPAFPIPPATRDRVTFIVPGPPRSKNRAHGMAWGINGPRVFVNKDSKRYQASVANHATSALGALIYAWREEPRYSKGKFRVDFVAYFDRESADALNPHELAADALQGVLFRNDRQIQHGGYAKYIDKVAPRLVVTVEAVG